jgi:hypothetical protein
MSPIDSLIEDRGPETPERIFAIIPKSANLRDGYTNTPYKQLVLAVDKFPDGWRRISENRLIWRQ